MTFLNTFFGAYIGTYGVITLVTEGVEEGITGPMMLVGGILLIANGVMESIRENDERKAGR